MEDLRSGGAVGRTADLVDGNLVEVRTDRVVGILLVDERVGRIGGAGCLAAILPESFEDLLLVLYRRWLLVDGKGAAFVLWTSETFLSLTKGCAANVILKQINHIVGHIESIVKLPVLVVLSRLVDADCGWVTRRAGPEAAEVVERVSSVVATREADSEAVTEAL